MQKSQKVMILSITIHNFIKTVENNPIRNFERKPVLRLKPTALDVWF